MVCIVSIGTVLFTNTYKKICLYYFFEVYNMNTIIVGKKYYTYNISKKRKSIKNNFCIINCKKVNIFWIFSYYQMYSQSKMLILMK